MVDPRAVEVGEANARRLGAAGSRLQVVLFAAAIWLPLIVAIDQRDGGVSEVEKRRLSELPTLEWSAASLGSFPARMDRYYDDHMGLRLALIRMQAVLEIEWLRRSPSPSLVVGRDGWLFFGDERAVAQYQGAAELSPMQLDAWRRYLEAERDALAARGIAFLVVFAPNKHSIYPENMPDHIPRVGARQPLTQLVEHLRATSTVTVLDLRPALLEAKKRRRVYHRTDTHWNDTGAHVAYREILRAVAAELPGFMHRQPVAVAESRATVPGMGLARLVGLSERYSEEITTLEPRAPEASVAPEFRASHRERVRRLEPFAMQVDSPHLPHVVVFRDSFGNALVPFLSESFGRTLFAWSRNVDPRIVELEKPDVVILEMAERFIGDVPESQFSPSSGR